MLVGACGGVASSENDRVAVFVVRPVYVLSIHDRKTQQMGGLLDLSGTPLSTEATAAVVSMCKSRFNGQNLITRLNLSACDIDDERGQMIVDGVLAGNSGCALTELTMDDNVFGDAVGLRMAKKLVGNRSIKRLSLRKNSLTSKSMEELGRQKQRNGFLLGVNGNAVEPGSKWPAFILQWESEWLEDEDDEEEGEGNGEDEEDGEDGEEDGEDGEEEGEEEEESESEIEEVEEAFKEADDDDEGEEEDEGKADMQRQLNAPFKRQRR